MHRSVFLPKVQYEADSQAETNINVSACFCLCTCVCVCVFVCKYVFCSRMGFATAVSRGWGNLVVEVEDAPEAFVEGHCAGEPRGRSAVN